jgi:hypothetical protein
MPISHYSQLPNTEPETYDKVQERVNLDGDPPAGLLFHVAAPGSDGGMWVFNVWESREDFDRFEQERLMPAVREVFGEDPGQPPMRSVNEIHHFVAP